MIFHKIFRFTNFLIFCIWGLQSCTKDDLIETPADTDSETTEPVWNDPNSRERPDSGCFQINASG